MLTGDLFALPLFQDGSTRACSLRLSFTAFNRRGVSSEMPACFRTLLFC